MPRNYLDILDDGISEMENYWDRDRARKSSDFRASQQATPAQAPVATGGGYGEGFGLADDHGVGGGVPFDMGAWSSYYNNAPANSPSALSYDNFVSWGPSGLNGNWGSSVARNAAGMSADPMGRILYRGKRLIT